jgi:nitroreductase
MNMDFLELAKKRCSVRKYDSKPVEKEKLMTILEAGRVAPTATNRQPYKIIVVETPAGLEKLQEGNNYMYKAPLALIVCADHNKTWKRPWDGKDSADTDIGIVTDHMMLSATDLGLGSIWLWAFDPATIRDKFNIPEHIEPVNILLIGYPTSELSSSSRHDTQRKALQETVVYETF